MPKLCKTAMCTIIGLTAVVMIFNYVNNGTGQDQIDAAQQAARNAAIQCYALEGAYPANIDYLYEHYGLKENKNIIIYYDYVASNLMPDILAAELG